MKDWAEKLDAFLKFNDRDVPEGAGRVSKKQADAHAEDQYEQFFCPAAINDGSRRCRGKRTSLGGCRQGTSKIWLEEQKLTTTSSLPSITARQISPANYPQQFGCLSRPP
ncbi:RhuM family protein [Pseudoduganella ginsengisoli]|uniref:RhuM family protein n=1 Tax=Pseudoduganella ginsengisoli TaxID=1462440 RepID=UPI001BABC893|nr:RhuM family protein [Pseudoduganella ginsengisoli]